ncbi:MAG: hypothetical protein K2Y37_01090 [Pirellulales bacterium]|nr:hypothetical protein [Pirellulales bacterium]
MVRRSSTSKAARETACANPVPAGAPSWVNAQLINQTIRVWQPYYAEPLTPEDALAIIQSVGRLIDVFQGESAQ